MPGGRPAVILFQEVGCSLRSIILAITLSVSLGLLSWISHYELVPRNELTVEVALMLTPWGILQNLLITPDSPLRAYYFLPTDRVGVFDDSSLAVGVVAVALQALALLAVMGPRRER